MSRVYHVLPAADRDLDDQAAYLLAEASLDTALRFYDAVSIAVGKIAGMPGIGEQWPSANPRLTGLRLWRIGGFENHLIFYLAADNGVEIIRVIHAARDYEAKTHLPQLLERVEHGETITITRHGKPVARLVPAAASVPRPDVAATLAAMAQFQEQEGPTLGGKITIRDLIDEGRR